MKHTWSVTLFLVTIFTITQIVGLGLISKAHPSFVDDQGVIQLETIDQVEAAQPEARGAYALLFVLVGVAVGTGLVFLLMKYRKARAWKAWYFLAIMFAMNYALIVFIPFYISIVVSAFLAWIKMYRRNVFTHNLTEVLVYSGLAVILSNIFNLLWASVLLVAIMIYDMIAVWKSGHMVKMAKFQANTGVFAGLAVPYSEKGISFGARSSKDKMSSVKGVRAGKSAVGKSKSSSVSASGQIPVAPLAGSADSLSGSRTAILGGGDIAFPLIFSGEAMLYLIRHGISQPAAFFYTLIITLFSGLALFLLFVYSRKDRFYPAMPFIGAGCFVGLGVVYVLAFLL